MWNLALENTKCAKTVGGKTAAPCTACILTVKTARFKTPPTRAAPLPNIPVHSWLFLFGEVGPPGRHVLKLNLVMKRDAREGLYVTNLTPPDIAT